MERAERQEGKVVKRKSAERREREQDDSVSIAGDREEVAGLKKRIARLESENRQLRKQIAVLTDSMGRSSQSHPDSVREQQHNFFKYSNVRRY
jgi:archaellum component FlaC